MNKPAHPVAAKPLEYPDYHKDGYGWAMAQAAIIRAGRLDSIDWENVAEEIESVGKRECWLAEEALGRVLCDQLKWELQPMFRSEFWADSIASLWSDFDDIIFQNPSLKPHLPEMLAFRYGQARRQAAIDTGFDIDNIPAEVPGWDDIRAPLLKSKTTEGRSGRGK